MRPVRAGVVRGREVGPVQATCEVVARSREGAYWRLSFAAREIAERAEPGQFVQIAVGGAHTLLRRPFSIANTSRQGVAAGTVDVVFDAHGPGTEWLAGVAVHSVIDVIGPLGTAFPLPRREVRCLLVGGGYGTAPLYFLGERLAAQGLRVDVIAGAATAERLQGVVEAKRLSASATFTTEDGSRGVTGRVTDVLEDVVAAAGSGVVYACGPNPMLAAVSAECRRLGLPVQVAVEERMACGTGVCFTCVLPVRTNEGEVVMQRTCLDGPVLDGARVAWDRSRYAVPADAGDTGAGRTGPGEGAR